ncbi:MAG: hypothetical protein AMXMBFR16_10950 [Candidatus Uhrbacteria bacterium]
MIRFCYNVARLFVILVGFTTFTAGSIFVTGKYVQELRKPVYQCASEAVFIYSPGAPASDYMVGAVSLARDRGLPISFAEDANFATPVMLFFDSDGMEINASRMTGMWNLYDMNIRFGIEPGV